MLNGLFLEKRIWNIDYLASEFWHPENYGVNIDLCPDPFVIPDEGFDKKYDFVIAADCWWRKIRRTLEYIRKERSEVKIFLMSKEPIVPKMNYGSMFLFKEHFSENSYYFKPDLVLAAGQAYADLWGDRARCKIVGYPRFEQYLSKSKFNIDEIKNKYGLSKDKRIILFPSFQPVFYKRIEDEDVYFDISREHEEIMMSLEELSKDDDIQVVVKIHPISQRNYNTNIGRYNDIAGILEKYYKNKSNKLLVIPDVNESGNIIKELIYASDIVMAFASTTLIESIFLKKPVINLLFGDLIGEEGLFLPDEIPSAYTREGLVSMVRSNNVLPVDGDKILEKYLYKVDGKSCERMCEIIKKECNK